MTNSIDTAEPTLPNLEDIAKRYATYEVEEKLGQLTFDLSSALHNAKFSDGSTFMYNDANGVRMYKEKLNDNQKEELANQLFNTLGYQLFMRKYKTSFKDFESFMNYKSASGQYLSEGQIQSEFGINKKALKYKILNMPKVDDSHIQELGGELIDHQKQFLESSIFSPLEEHHTPALKEYIKAQLKATGQGDSKLMKDIENRYGLQSLVPLYKMVSKNKYMNPN